jgi:hypothetical protein
MCSPNNLMNDETATEYDIFHWNNDVSGPQEKLKSRINKTFWMNLKSSSNNSFFHSDLNYLFYFLRDYDVRLTK